MSSETSFANTFKVKKVENRSGTEVDVEFKEDYLVSGDPRTRHLRRLFEAHGLKVEVRWKILHCFVNLTLSRVGGGCLTTTDVKRMLDGKDMVELSLASPKSLP